MIDTLIKQLPNFKKPKGSDFEDLETGNYFVMTMHRPANVDQEHQLKAMVYAILEGIQGLPIIFPVHPRTAKNLQAIGLDAEFLLKCEPLGYLGFNYLVKNEKGVTTDSGGITEEASVMNVPCITLRDNTET